jgi:hypothetical protein
MEPNRPRHQRDELGDNDEIDDDARDDEDDPIGHIRAAIGSSP